MTNMKFHALKIILFGVLVILPSITMAQSHAVDYEATVIANGGSGNFAPYYIASNRHGIITQSSNALLRASISHQMDTSKRFSYGYGLDLIGGYGSKVTYERYNESIDMFVANQQSPSNAWIQQLYAEMKYRAVFLTVGQKQHASKLLNNELSSGDLLESGNARPIPEVRAGFIDFVDIPLTNGWVQIGGEISYGKFTDDDYIRNHYSYYNSHINTGGWYTYKRAYFRTRPAENFSVTIGAQAAGLFGGTMYDYNKGKLYSTYKHPDGIKEFFEMFIPKNTTEEGFVLGNHLGSWDFMARYRLSHGNEFKLYFQWPWEDGSGIGKLNGFDGLWGVEYRSANQNIVNGVVAEYLDFTNQSGPMHWDPDDMPGTTITDRAEGGDNYYNNSFYNSYANYGMSIGTPFLRAPIYNLDGYPAYICNRVRGVHLGISGNLTPELDYRLKASYRKGWGAGRVPLMSALEDTSVSIDAKYMVPAIDGLSVALQVAMDRGSMYGDNFGCLVGISYKGNFNIGK